MQRVYLGSARLVKPRWLTALGEARVGAQLSRAGLDIEWLPETERRRARAEVTKLPSRAAAQRDAGAARIQDTSALHALSGSRLSPLRASLHVCADSCKSERSVARLTTSSAMSRPLGVSMTLGMLRKRGSRMIYRNTSNPIFPLPMCS